MSKPKGFTLLEVLVAITIIMLLMSIFLPATRQIRNKARALICQTNLKEWGTTFALYANENSGRMPRCREDIIWLLRGGYVYEGDPNTPKVQQDITTKDIACCPMAQKPAGREGFGMVKVSKEDSYTLKGTYGSTFGAWELTTPPPKFRCSYGLNGDLFDPVFPFQRTSNQTINIYCFTETSRTPLFLDSLIYAGYMNYKDKFRKPPISDGYHDFCINRHDGYINGLFLDSSVRKIGLKELWTLKWDEDFDTNGPWTKAGGVQPEDWPEWMRDFKDY